MVLQKNVLNNGIGFRALDASELEIVSGGGDHAGENFGNGPNGSDGFGDGSPELPNTEPDHFIYERVVSSGAAASFGWVENSEGGGYIDQSTGYFIDADGQVWRDFQACVDAGAEGLQADQASVGNNYLGPLGQLIDQLGDSLGFEFPAEIQNAFLQQAANHCANG